MARHAIRPPKTNKSRAIGKDLPVRRDSPFCHQKQSHNESIYTLEMMLPGVRILSPFGHPKQNNHEL